jgi:hypothetical protein
MQINWLWLVVGLVPYSIKQQQMKDEHIVTVKALFWRLMIRWKNEKCSWNLSIPLITGLKQ